ncbi:MAG: phosphatidylglycerophosphate synthase [Clostridiaceae bacterium]|jgi:cardiolipin synthase|nr:phosphatidylglycerophosphate synthase [Clostridiaceae bacterium]
MIEEVLKISKSKWRHIPNILTILRLIVIPIMVYYMLRREWVISLIIFVSAEITDVLDGYIARKYNFISKFGKLADPLADKLLQLTALFFLSRGDIIPSHFFYILCIKELAMVVGALLFLKKDVVVHSNWMGKAAATILFLGIILAFLNLSISVVILCIGVIVSIVAGVFYLKAFLQQVKGSSN